MSIELLEEREQSLSERGILRVTEDQLDEIVADRIAESIDDVRALLRKEDVGWTLLKGHPGEDGGLSLDDLKEWSDKLRSSTIAAPWIGRGFRLRHGFIWDGGIKYAGIPEDAQGRKSIKALLRDKQNRREFFGPKARKQREGRLYHDGFALWIGRNSTKKLESIPLDQIAGEIRHPELPGVNVGYLRKWRKYDFSTGQYKDKSAYYIVYGYESMFDRIRSIKPNAAEKAVVIDKTYTAFHQHANPIDGFAYGVPDALAAWIWNAIGRDAYMDGATMTKALASIAFKATSKSKSGAQNLAAQVARGRGAAQTAALGGATDISALASAGKGYDYDSLRGLVATIAAALDLSVIHLTADPGAAGSSYGSAQTLDLPGRMTTQARRDEHIEVDTEVLEWMGAPEPSARFNTLEDPVLMYRRLQAEVMPWLQGVETPEMFQKRSAEALGLAEGELGEIPDGVMTPNNKNFIMRPDVDADGQKTPTGSAAGPTQGKDAGAAAAADGSNDVRQD